MKVENKPWVLNLLTLLAWATVASGVYLERLVGTLKGLDVDALVVAAGFLTAGNALYGYNSRRVKETTITHGRSYESIASSTEEP